jgi:hypothetical protein
MAAKGVDAFVLQDSKAEESWGGASNSDIALLAEKNPGALEPVGFIEEGETLVAPVGYSLYRVTLVDEETITFRRMPSSRCPVILSVDPSVGTEGEWSEWNEPRYNLGFRTMQTSGAGASWGTDLEIDGKTYREGESYSALGHSIETDFPVYVRVKRGQSSGYVRIDLSDRLTLRDCVGRKP